MKKTKQWPIDIYDRNDLKQAVQLTDILFQVFSIKSAEKARDHYEEEEGDFCSDCEQKNDDCDCRRYERDYEPDYDDFEILSHDTNIESDDGP